MKKRLDAFTIIALENKDIPALIALEKQCFSSCWTAHQYELFLGSSNAGGLLVKHALQPRENAVACGFVFGMMTQEGELVGYTSLVIQYAVHELEVFNIAIREKHRKQGFARHLLVTILTVACAIGISRVLLEVREGNSAAICLYTSLGFVECGRRKKYYTDTGEDALLFVLENNRLEKLHEIAHGC